MAPEATGAGAEAGLKYFSGSAWNLAWQPGQQK
jgi:hypothetical protein